MCFLKKCLGHASVVWRTGDDGRAAQQAGRGWLVHRGNEGGHHRQWNGMESDRRRARLSLCLFPLPVREHHRPHQRDAACVLRCRGAAHPPDYVIPFMLMMTASSAIMMTLTHYATGTSPIIFGSGYVSLGAWWKIGLVMCLLELLIFGLVGSIWWKILGFW